MYKKEACVSFRVSFGKVQYRIRLLEWTFRCRGLDRCDVVKNLMLRKNVETIYRSPEEYEVSLLCSESTEVILRPGNNIRILLGGWVEEKQQKHI